MGGAQSSTKNTESIQRECVLDCNHATTIACHFSLQKLPTQRKQIFVIEYIFSTINFWINTLKTLNAGYKNTHILSFASTTAWQNKEVKYHHHHYGTLLLLFLSSVWWWQRDVLRQCLRMSKKSCQIISDDRVCVETAKVLVRNLLNWTKKTNQLTLCYISMT